MIFVGIIDHFLSAPVFAPLARLSFAMYLLHQHMIVTFHYSRKDIMHFDIYIMVRKLNVFVYYWVTFKKKNLWNCRCFQTLTLNFDQQICLVTLIDIISCI